MDERQFDRITRRLAERPVTRRSFFGLVGGVIAGGLAVVGLGERAQWSRAMSQADSEEQSVMLFEQMAEIIHAHTGGCAELRDKMRDFQDDNYDLLAQIAAEQSAWTDEQRAKHADTYGDRRMAAVDKINTGLQQCENVDAAATPGASPVGTAATPDASPVAAALHGIRGLTADEPACQAEVELSCLQPKSGQFAPFWSGTATCKEAPLGCTPCGLTAADCNNKFPNLCSDPDADSPCIPVAEPTADSCIYPVTVGCYPGIGGAMVPGSAYSATAKCDKSGNCTPCDMPSNYCVSEFPNECPSGEACTVEVVAADTCTTPVTAQCMLFGSNRTWSSDGITVWANCDNGPRNCTFCDDAEICGTMFPDICGNLSPTEECSLEQHLEQPPPHCCSSDCPQTTAQCVTSGFLTAMLDGCFACFLEWCGSTSHCIDFCEKTSCCSEACQSGGPWDGGGGPWAARSGGTPVAIGTPGTPVVTPTTTGTAPATGTPVPPTVALPTQPPPTVALPTDVALPTQPPPTVALPTEAPPTEPPATPATPATPSS